MKVGCSRQVWRAVRALEMPGLPADSGRRMEANRSHQRQQRIQVWGEQSGVFISAKGPLGSLRQCLHKNETSWCSVFAVFDQKQGPVVLV